MDKKTHKPQASGLTKENALREAYKDNFSYYF